MKRLWMILLFSLVFASCSKFEETMAPIEPEPVNTPPVFTQFLVFPTSLTLPDDKVTVVAKAEDEHGIREKYIKISSSSQVEPERVDFPSDTVEVRFSQADAYNLRAVAVDSLGAVNDSQSLTVIVNPEPPAEPAKSFLKVRTFSAADSSEINADIFLNIEDVAGGSVGKSPTRLIEVAPASASHDIVAKAIGFLSADTTVTVSLGDTLIVPMVLAPIPEPPVGCRLIPKPLETLTITINKPLETAGLVTLSGDLDSLLAEVKYSKTQTGQSQEIFRVGFVTTADDTLWSKFVPDNVGGVKLVPVELAQPVPAGTYELILEHAARTDSTITDKPSSLQFFLLLFCVK